ncbi:hypothetical protein CAEBREN_18920 [Caenorhabditis brenneri]|uniref:C2H2-type domain-containing protein n=1 Tax=Caenorhabditis brenneri TaxID=135651 RepID=G0PG63_CAEBE|nr:hypothetical protein CAEBREN_18920 [Caenorhabditis brenneri]
MTEGGPIPKKFRIWNPAVSELSSENQEEEEEAQTQDEESSNDEKPLDCTSKNHQQFQFPEVFQNYLQLAPLMLRLQQQELARRQFLSIVSVAAPPPQIPHNPSILAPNPSFMAGTSKNSKSLGAGPLAPPTMNNPLVATALGSQLVNENCCAVCGSVFRLTGDLVQHMRNNHRKSKFKRKADLGQ